MGATVWKTAFLPLEDKEGELRVLAQQWEKPTKPETDSIRLDSEPVITHGHYPFCEGLMSVVKVSESKSILYCKKCGLRISFPPSIETVGELAKYFSK